MSLLFSWSIYFQLCELYVGLVWTWNCEYGAYLPISYVETSTTFQHLPNRMTWSRVEKRKAGYPAKGLDLASF
jgi:hypothetical protein